MRSGQLTKIKISKPAGDGPFGRPDSRLKFCKSILHTFDGFLDQIRLLCWGSAAHWFGRVEFRILNFYCCSLQAGAVEKYKAIIQNSKFNTSKLMSWREHKTQLYLHFRVKDGSLYLLYSVLDSSCSNVEMSEKSCGIRPHLHERGAIIRAVYHVRERRFISTWCKHPIGWWHARNISSYLLIRDSIRCLLHSHLHNRHHNIRHLLRSRHQGSHLCHPGDQNQVQAGHQLQLFSVFFCHCYCKKNEKRKF
jgi:hypothetical protein